MVSIYGLKQDPMIPIKICNAKHKKNVDKFYLGIWFWSGKVEHGVKW